MKPIESTGHKMSIAEREVVAKKHLLHQLERIGNQLTTLGCCQAAGHCHDAALVIFVEVMRDP